MNYGAAAFINLSALQSNYAQVRKFAPGRKVMAMIKSNAYGHGLIEVAQALSDADAFGVACFSEAIALRKAGITKPIVLMRGFTSATELLWCLDANLEVVIHDVNQLNILSQVNLVSPLSVWFKIDTGMRRLGFLPEQVEAAYQQLKNNKWLKIKGVMTHFSSSDDLSKRSVQKQLALFLAIAEDMSEPKSLANSGAIINCPETHGDWVRPGIMLYGVSPIADKTGVDYGLKPVMTLRSKLISVKNIGKGDKVGYGENWQCPMDTRLGVVAIGYGDGYPRNAVNKTPVLVNDCLCELIGRVSMDMIAVDLKNIKAKVGDQVTLWGDGLPVEHVAHSVNTIPYDLLCGVTRRVEYKYIL